MNTGTWTLIAWLCILGFVPVGTYLGWHYGRVEGRHEGRCAEKERELARRHRAELRVSYEGPEIRAKTGPLIGFPIHDAPWGSIPIVTRPAPPPVITAADLQPVIVPEPKLTDTGELRAINARGEAIRKAMLTGTQQSIFRSLDERRDT